MPQDKVKFDPDKYLSKFNPDKYLGKDTTVVQPTPQRQPSHAENVRNILSSPIESGKTAISQLQSGEPVAGGINILNTLMRALSVPGQLASYGYRNVGLPAVANILEAPGRVAETLLYDLPKPILESISPEIPLSPATNQALEETGRGLSQMAGYGALPKVKAGVESVGRGIQNVARKSETKAITPPFDAKKGLEVFDRPVATALEDNYAPSRSGIAKLVNDKKVLNNKMKSVANESAQRGTTIDLNDTISFLNDQITKADRASAYYDETVAAVNDAQGRITRILQKYPNGKVPIDVAVELKSSFGKLASPKFDESVAPSQIKIDTYKQTFGKLLEQVINEEPKLRKMGLKERDLIDLEPVLGRKIAQVEKTPYINWQNLRKLGLAGAVGAASGEPLAGFAMFGAEQALSNPRTLHAMSMAADRTGRGISNVGKNIPVSDANLLLALLLQNANRK